jgi:DNA repair ATPase RecN
MLKFVLDQAEFDQLPKQLKSHYQPVADFHCLEVDHIQEDIRKLLAALRCERTDRKEVSNRLQALKYQIKKHNIQITEAKEKVC